MLAGWFEDLAGCLDDASARRIVALKAPVTVQRRVEALAEAANEGVLTAEEREEYDLLIQVGDFMAMLKIAVRRRFAMPDADEIAAMAGRGEDVSAYFTNEFTVVRPKPRNGAVSDAES